MAGPRKVRPAHRPQRYDPAVHIPLLHEMFNKGKSITAYLVEAKIAETTFYEWTNIHPDFDEAYEAANNAAKRYWEDLAEANIFQPGFNFALYNSIMINRFGQTAHRKLKIKNIASVESHTDRFNVVMQEVAKGGLTGHELKQISESLVCGVKIAEVTDMAEDIKELQQRVSDNYAAVDDSETPIRSC